MNSNTGFITLMPLVAHRDCECTQRCEELCLWSLPVWNGGEAELWEERCIKDPKVKLLHLPYQSWDLGFCLLRRNPVQVISPSQSAPDGARWTFLWLWLFLFLPCSPLRLQTSSLCFIHVLVWYWAWLNWEAALGHVYTLQSWGKRKARWSWGSSEGNLPQICSFFNSSALLGHELLIFFLIS